MSSVELSISKLTDEIRVHGTIVIIGAGASFEAGLPLYSQFSSIIWQVIDEFPILKNELGSNQDIPAKAIIGTDIDRIKNSFAYIERYADSSLRFKEIFKAVNDRHHMNYSYAHECICRMIHNEHIKLVISLNWDDLLEMAWERIYGTKINANKINLLKPHGDVRNIKNRWVYPNNSGNITEVDLEIINNISKNGPSALIILGYSESDKIIVDKLIQPGEEKSKTYRISPSSVNSIPLKATEAIRMIYDKLPQNNDQMWSHVDFSNQVGLEHAIMGYRLLPSDVSACARLPQIEDIKYRLEQAHSVIIKGAPGCGKSITAYQVAFDYLGCTWEVLRLNNSKLTPGSTIRLDNNNYKAVYIIDDAQQMEKDQIIKLINSANKTKKVIITQTLTSEFPYESITISQEQSIKAIYDHYLKHKLDVVTIIKQPNKNIGRYIGDLYMETPFEFILDVAHKEENPWMFNYSIRGGWQNTKNQYSLTKEHKRADVLWTLIAFKQIITLDRPVDIKWLYDEANHWGYSTNWCDTTIQYLFEEKLILSSDEIRTLHLQTAIRVVVNYIDQASSKEYDMLNKLIQNELISNDTPLQGVLWFFNLMFSFEGKYKLLYNVLTKQFCDQMLEKCFMQYDSEGRSYAAYVIDAVLHRDGNLEYKSICEKYNNVLQLWFEQVDSDTALSFSHILNNMINEDRKEERKFISSLNLEKICLCLKSIDSDSLYNCANFINRLSVCQTKKWNSRLYALLPKKEINIALQNTKYTDIYGMMEMLYALLLCDKDYGYSGYYLCLPIIKHALIHNFSGTLGQLDLHFLMYFCGEGLFDMGRPNELQKQAGKAFIECITAEMITKCIMKGVPRDWERLYRFINEILRYDANKLNDAIKQIDYSVIDERTSGLWSNQPNELLMLVNMIKISNDNIGDWVYSHRDEANLLRTPLIIISPQTAEYLFINGKEVLLIDTNHHWWDTSVKAIVVLKSYNKGICSNIIKQNIERIKESLIELSPLDWDDYHKFFLELTKADAILVENMLSGINATDLQEKWEAKIDSPNDIYKRKKKHINGILKLIGIIIHFTSNTDLLSAMDYLYIKQMNYQQNSCDNALRPDN